MIAHFAQEIKKEERKNFEMKSKIDLLRKSQQSAQFA